jgi:hypothetical protein
MYDPVSVIPPDADDAPQLTVEAPKTPAPALVEVFEVLQERSLFISAWYIKLTVSEKTRAPPELLCTSNPRNEAASFAGCPWTPLPVVFTVLDPVAFTPSSTGVWVVFPLLGTTSKK